MNPTTGLLDVFSHYGGNVIFQRLVSSTSASGSILGQIGWLFTAAGALLILWGHVCRMSRAQPGDRVAELGRTALLFAAMTGAPFMVRTAMQGADSVFSSIMGGPDRLTMACVKAAYLMPELNHLFDRIGAQTAQAPTNLVASDDSTQTGYIASFFLSMWNTAADYAATIKGTIQETMRLAAVLSGLGAATAKIALAALMLIPVYLLFLVSGSIIWFMAQMRFFLAVVSTLMLPPFVGMYSLPADHPNRGPATRYMMNLLSLTMWPLAWTIGHAGTIVLFDALAGLVSDCTRTPALGTLLSWDSLTSGTQLTDAQVQAGEAALGNLFMGGMASELAILVGAVGFTLWVFLVAIAGPLIFHRVFAVGSLYAVQALQMGGTAGMKVASVAAMAGPTAGRAVAPLVTASQPPSPNRPVSAGPDKVFDLMGKGAPERSLEETTRQVLAERGRR